jgi:hypothetical protein
MRNYFKFTSYETVIENNQERSFISTDRFVFFDDESAPLHAPKPRVGERLSRAPSSCVQEILVPGRRRGAVVKVEEKVSIIDDRNNIKASYETGKHQLSLVFGNAGCSHSLSFPSVRDAQELIVQLQAVLDAVKERQKQ